MPKLSVGTCLGLLLLLHAAAHTLLLVPGPLSVDEVGYHLMTRAVAAGTPWEIWNGYDELPCQELEVTVARTVIAHDGHLVGKYPPLLPWLAAALYPHFGFRSLVLVNIAAFTVALWLTWSIANRYLRAPWQALLAPLVLGLTTYAWEYAQGAWPHGLALMFSTGAFDCAGRALAAWGGRRSRAVAWRWALGSGLLLGLGSLARLDVFLFIAVVGTMLLSASPPAPRLLAAVILGSSVGLLFLSIDNAVRLGIPFPFTYNRSTLELAPYARYAPLFLLFGLVVAVRLSWSKPVGQALRAFAARALATRAARGAVLTVMLLALLLTPVREALEAHLLGVRDLLLDLASLDPNRREPAMERTATGAVLYFGHYKKALLQSCPYLAALVFLVRARSTGKKPRPPRWHLVLPLIVLLSAFSGRSWHGGMSLNMRYLLPALPMTSVATVWVLRESLPAGWLSRLTGAALCATVAVLFLRQDWSAGPWTEFLLLTVPLLLAGTLAVLFLSRALLQSSSPTRALSTFGGIALLVSMTWASLVALGYDYPAQRRLRAFNQLVSTTAREHVPEDALLFMPLIDRFSGLIDVPGVRLANPLQDGFRCFVPLLRHHLSQGRPVYGAFSAPMWNELVRSPAFRGISAEPVIELPGGALLARLSRARDGN